MPASGRSTQTVFMTTRQENLILTPSPLITSQTRPVKSLSERQFKSVEGIAQEIRKLQGELEKLLAKIQRPK